MPSTYSHPIEIDGLKDPKLPEQSRGGGVHKNWRSAMVCWRIPNFQHRRRQRAITLEFQFGDEFEIVIFLTILLLISQLLYNNYFSKVESFLIDFGGSYSCREMHSHYRIKRRGQRKVFIENFHYIPSAVTKLCFLIEKTQMFTLENTSLLHPSPDGTTSKTLVCGTRCCLEQFGTV